MPSNSNIVQQQQCCHIDRQYAAAAIASTSTHIHDGIRGASVNNMTYPSSCIRRTLPHDNRPTFAARIDILSTISLPTMFPSCNANCSATDNCSDVNNCYSSYNSLPCSNPHQLLRPRQLLPRANCFRAPIASARQLLPHANCPNALTPTIDVAATIVPRFIVNGEFVAHPEFIVNPIFFIDGKFVVDGKFIVNGEFIVNTVFFVDPVFFMVDILQQQRHSPTIRPLASSPLNPLFIVHQFRV